MQMTPYLNFNGDCREAFGFYNEVLGGGEPQIMTYGDSPMCDEMPADSHDRIMHAQLNVNGALLMGADGPPGADGPSRNMSVALTVDESADADRIFNTLLKGGQVTMPIQETFWATRFGMGIDRYGTPWIINGGMKDLHGAQAKDLQEARS